MRNKIAAILMALCMAVSLLPVQAMAEGPAYSVGGDAATLKTGLEQTESGAGASEDAGEAADPVDGAGADKAADGAGADADKASPENGAGAGEDADKAANPANGGAENPTGAGADADKATPESGAGTDKATNGADGDADKAMNPAGAGEEANPANPADGAGGDADKAANPENGAGAGAGATNPAGADKADAANGADAGADEADAADGAAAVQAAGGVARAGAAAPTLTGTALTQELIERKKGYDKSVGIQLPAGEYYLTENVYLVGDDAGAWPLSLFDGAVTLDLNGYVLDLRGANILAYGNLTLKDSSTGGQPHKFRVEESGLWVWDETNGTETVTGGVITGGVGITMDGGSCGGGVYVYNGKNLTMEGGSIVGCTASFGGGVYMMGGDNSTFTMEGGRIVGCAAGKNGGGVYVGNKSGYLSTTKFTMKDGSIEDCTAANGGGVYTQSNTEFTMEGGSIQHCTAIETGGGVYGASTFTMTNGSIEDCAATNGGGVFVGAADTSTMEGGRIVGCTAANGGGVYVGDTRFTMTNGSIEDCTATQAGGGVFVVKMGSSHFTIEDGSIENCAAGGAPNAVHADGGFTDNGATKIDKSLLSGINGGQTGAENDPILIGSAEGLKDFRDRVNGIMGYAPDGAKPALCARLLCDIVLNGGTFDEDGKYKNEKGNYANANTWTPIGTDGKPYSGTFDGNGKTIKGLYVKDQPYAGVFGYVKTDSYGSLTFAVKDLTVTGYIGVSMDSEKDVYAGGIIGCAEISPYGDGAESGTVSGCVNRVVINASSTGERDIGVYAGGIVGGVKMSNYSHGGTATMEITNCANYAAITAYSENGSAYAGGIAGQINGSNSTQKINSCFNAGEIRASYGKWSACAGGIIGEAFNGMSAESSAIANCLNVGDVTGVKGSTNAGGIAGKDQTVPISNCCNAGKVDGTSNGGIAGNVAGGATVSNCYYLEGTAANGAYNFSHEEYLKTKAEFANGTVLGLLKQNGTNDAWGDECGYLEAVKMTLPLLKGQTGDEHSHDGAAWLSDSANHWRECSCGVIYDKAGHTGGAATCSEKATCSVCGAEYGEKDATKHRDLKHVEAKAATTSAEGNIEYWYCAGCGKYYKDAAARQEITQADTVTAKLPSGGGSSSYRPAVETSARTADDSHAALWYAAMVIAALGAAAVVRRKKAE